MPAPSGGGVTWWTVLDRWCALDRGWRATALGVALAAGVELAVRAGLL